MPLPISSSHESDSSGNVMPEVEAMLARIQSDHRYHGVHEDGENLIKQLEEQLQKLEIQDTHAQLSSGFKTKTTVGVMFHGGAIDSMVVGGPAYNCRQLEKGDVVTEIDGQAVTGDNLSQLLVGCDKPGTPVKLSVRKGGKTGVKKTVTLLRMSSEAIADRRRLFELFTSMKARAALPKAGGEAIEGIVDNAIQLWTRMTIAEAEFEEKIRTTISGVQQNATECINVLRTNAETKKKLYFERHDDSLGFKDYFLQLDAALKKMTVEHARLTLALKEAACENNTSNAALQAQLNQALNDFEMSKTDAANKDMANAALIAQLQAQLQEAQDAVEKSKKDAANKDTSNSAFLAQLQAQLKEGLDALEKNKKDAAYKDASNAALIAQLQAQLKMSEAQLQTHLKEAEKSKKDAAEALEKCKKDAATKESLYTSQMEAANQEIQKHCATILSLNKDMEQLKKELTMTQSNLKQVEQEKNSLGAQADQLKRTVLETTQQLNKAVSDANAAEAEYVKMIAQLKANLADLELDFKSHIEVQEAAARELEVGNLREKERLLNQLQCLKNSLQCSERDRHVIRDKMSNFFEVARSLGKEVDVVVAEGRKTLEQQKKNALLVEQVLGELKACKSLHQREREGLVTHLYATLQALQDMHTALHLPPGILQGGIASTVGEGQHSVTFIPDQTATKKKKGKGGGGSDNTEDLKGNGKIVQRTMMEELDMTLDMFSEGSMEDRDAHVSRIYCTLKSDSQKSYLVQLPPGFGKGEFAVGNSVFIRKVVHDVTANGQAMIHALVSHQKDLEKFAQRWKESEERCVSMAQKCEDVQKELNDTRAAHNAQIQHNIELQKTLRQVETETHNLSLELQQVKDTEGKQRDRIQALTSHTTSLAERVSQLEAELEVARGETQSLVGELGLVKAKLRAAEENAMNHEEIGQKAQGQVSTLVFNLDKAEVGLKQKECEVQALQQQVTVMSQSMEQMKATIQQNEGKLADFKQWLHETKQQFDEAKWREKSLTKDVAAAVQREQDMQQRVREMDARIVELEHSNFSLSSTAETRRAQLQKANADTARLEEDAKKLQLQLKDADKKHVAAKEEYELSLKAKTNDFFAAFGAIEQIHTGVCQPHVGIAHGIGISLEESQREIPRGDWETSKVHETCCKVESIIKHGVAENEGTLRAGDVIQEVDKVNVTGLSFEEIQGLLVGVAGSSVNIRGLHAPYTPADEFCAVLIRSAYSRAHFIKNLDVESGIDVNALAEQVLREAFVLRNAVVDLKTANVKLSDKLNEDEVKLSMLESEKTLLKEQLGEIGVKYDIQVSRLEELTKAKRKTDDALQNLKRQLENEQTQLRLTETNLANLRLQYEQLNVNAKETGEELIHNKNALSKASQLSKELKEEINEHLKNITEEGTARQKAEVQVSQLAYQLDFAQTKIKSLKMEVKELENKTAKQKDEISDLKAIVEQKAKEISVAIMAIRHTHSVVCHRTVGIAKGIGITLSLQQEGVCRIESVITGGVAHLEGSLKVGDIITKVDRVSVMESSIAEIHEMLSGSAGSSVTITAKRWASEDKSEKRLSRDMTEDARDFSVILLRASIDASGGEDANELCNAVNEAYESLRSQMVVMQSAMTCSADKVEQQQAEHLRESSRMLSQIEELASKVDRMNNKNSLLNTALASAQEQLSATQSAVAELEAQNFKLEQNLQRLTGVHEQLKVSLDDLKNKWSETVKDLEDERDKHNKAQAELQELEKGRTKDKKTLDELETLQRKLENQLESEQVRAKKLKDEIKSAQEQLSATQSAVAELEAQKFKVEQNLHKLTGVHEQLRVSADEAKDNFSETVKNLEDERDKLKKAQAELQELEKGRAKDKKARDELELLQRKLENQLESEQARTKKVHDELNMLKSVSQKRDGDMKELEGLLARTKREKDDALFTIQTLTAEVKEHVWRNEAYAKDLKSAEAKLSKEAERLAELSYSLDRSQDMEKTVNRELNDTKRKLDAEIFAKDQSLRREETSKRSLSECQDHAAEFKQQAEAEISQLRKEVVHIWGAFQKTHAKVCGQVVGSAAGVGLFLVDSESPDDGVRVESIVPGRSASLDGRIHPGDKILEVNGENVRRHGAEYIYALLSGDTGSSVTVKAQRPNGGNAFLVTFVRSSAKSKCMNSEDASELCHDVEMVVESFKNEAGKLRENISEMQRKHAEDRELAAQDHAQLTALLEDAKAKLSRAMQKDIEMSKAMQELQEQLDSSNQCVKQMRAALEFAQSNHTTLEEGKRSMENKLKYHESKLRHWAAQQAAILRDNYSGIEQTVREIESGVLETVRSNLRLSSELDVLQVHASKLEPELQANQKNLLDNEFQLRGAQERVRKLENERRNYETNRSDILGQLQDALLREQDLRQRMTHLEKDISELKEDNKNAELHINQDDLKMNRLLDQVRVLESKLADARDLDNARQQEMTVLDRKLADSNEKFADQLSKLSKDLDMCYNAARQMHLAVCRPVMGLTGGIGILVISAGASGGCRVASVEPHLHVTPPNSNKMLQRGDLIIEIDGKDVRYENDKLVQNLLIGPVESQVKIVLQRAESDEVYSVCIQRGTAGAGVTTIIPDLLRDVKNTCTTLHGDIEKLRTQNGQLKEKVSQVSSMHENEVKQLRAVQADLQVQLDSQLRNVSNLQRDKALLEQGSKELGIKVDDLEKQLRAAKLKFQQDCDEIARLEAQREELKNGNNGARESLHKALADIKVMQSKTESQADTIAELERDKRKLQTEVADRDLNLVEMSKQLAMAVRQYQDAECEIGRLLQENKAISADVEAIKSQNEGLESQVRDLKKSQADATARLNDCDRLLRSSEKNDQSRVAMIEDLEKRLKAANHRQHQLVDELSAMTGEVNKIKDASNHGAQEKDERILELQEAVDKERIFVDELSKKLATIELSKSEYKSKVSTLETKCSDLEKKVKAASERESGLQEEMRRASEELANLRTKSSDTIAELEDRIAELRAEMTANKNEVADLHDRLKHQLWDNNTLKTLVSEKDTRIEDAEKQLRAANLRLQELEARQQELLNKLSKFKSTGAEQNSVLAAKDAQIEGLLERIAGLQKQLNALSDVEKKLRESLSTIDELKSDLYRANKEIKELQKQVIGLQEQRDKLLALQDDLMRRISEYESLRMSAKDKGTMTDAVKPERKVEPKPPPAPPKAQKLCGLGMRVTEEPPHRIVELIEGGAAKISNKLLVGDHILKIAGKETKGLTMPQVRDLIVGPPGSVVTLCVNRKVDDHEQVFDIDLTREEIRTPRDNTPRNSAKSSTEALAGLTTSFSNFFN